MKLEAKQRLACAVDALAARGQRADQVRMHPDTARDLSIFATHLNLSAHHDAAQIAAELVAPSYDGRAASDPHGWLLGDKFYAQHPDDPAATPVLSRPKSADDAARIAGPRCASSLRRDVVLRVALDESVEVGKLVVTAPTVASEEV